jgi:Glucosamine-6-phosphate isomerases/6-phosphogluconolactonase
VTHSESTSGLLIRSIVVRSTGRGSKFFWGDERALPSEYPDSNHGMANAAHDLERLPSQLATGRLAWLADRTAASALALEVRR